MLGVKVVEDQTILGEVVNKNGILYYYAMGKADAAGFVQVDDAYYFADVDGKVAIGHTYVWKGNGIVPEGHYEFDENGKALNGFITRDGILYYYQNGRAGQAGLHYIDGYYYCLGNDGSVWVNGTYYVYQTNGYSLPMVYTFDELGRVVL